MRPFSAHMLPSLALWCPVHNQGLDPAEVTSLSLIENLAKRKGECRAFAACVDIQLCTRSSRCGAAQRMQFCMRTRCPAVAVCLICVIIIGCWCIVIVLSCSTGQSSFDHTSFCIRAVPVHHHEIIEGVRGRYLLVVNAT